MRTGRLTLTATVVFLGSGTMAFALLPPDPSINIGTLPPGKRVVLRLKARVGAVGTFAAGVSTVSNQGTVSGSNFTTVQTDDPSTVAANDPTVIPVNRTPVFAGGTAAIAEQSPNTTPVTTTTGSDVDATGTNAQVLGYSITAGNGTGGGAFAINAGSGAITVADATQIDYEATAPGHAFTLTVRATDNGAGSLFAEAPVTVNLSDIAEMTNTVVASTRNPADVGDGVTFSAAVASVQGPTPTGSVQFKIDGTDFGAAQPVTGGPTASASIPATATSPTLGAGTHTVSAAFTPSNNILASTGNLSPNQLVVSATAVSPGDVIISEMRFRGALGAADEFVELYNTKPYPIQLKADGWALRGSDNSGAVTATLGVIPGGTTIPPLGHYLVVNDTALSGFRAGELHTYAAGTVAPGFVDAGDLQEQVDIADNGGVALFATHTTPFTPQLDAAGFGGYVEGTPLTPGTGIFTSSQHSFMRRLDGGGKPADTNVNENDFVFISTTGAMIDLRQSQLGNPNPERLSSPRNEAGLFLTELCDPLQLGDAGQNRVRNTTPLPSNGPQGSMDFRRKFTNNTGQPVSRLRFRLINLTTLGSPTVFMTGIQSELRILNAPDLANVAITGGGTIPAIKGWTLEGPPGITMGLGGGLGSTGTISTITLGTPLANGASIYVNMRAGVQITGKYNFFVILEAEKQ